MLEHLVFVLDDNYLRCRSVSNALAKSGFGSAGYSDLEELFAEISERVVIFVHDEGGLVEKVLQRSRLDEALVAVVAYSEYPEPRAIARAIRLGAIDYCQLPLSPEGLRYTVYDCLEIAEGNWSNLERLAPARKKIGSLSRREEQVLSYIIRGVQTRAIGAELGISPRTVEIYRRHLLRKLNAPSSSSMVQIAVAAGFEA